MATLNHYFQYKKCFAIKKFKFPKQSRHTDALASDVHKNIKTLGNSRNNAMKIISKYGMKHVSERLLEQTSCLFGGIIIDLLRPLFDV